MTEDVPRIAMKARTNIDAKVFMVSYDVEAGFYRFGLHKSVYVAYGLWFMDLIL